MKNESFTVPLLKGISEQEPQLQDSLSELETGEQILLVMDGQIHLVMNDTSYIETTTYHLPMTR